MPPGTLRSSAWTRTRFFFHHLQRVFRRKFITKDLRHGPGLGSSSSFVKSTMIIIDQAKEMARLSVVAKISEEHSNFSDNWEKSLDGGDDLLLLFANIFCNK